VRRKCARRSKIGKLSQEVKRWKMNTHRETKVMFGASTTDMFEERGKWPVVSARRELALTRSCALAVRNWCKMM